MQGSARGRERAEPSGVLPRTLIDIISTLIDIISTLIDIISTLIDIISRVP
jgi:hypothetical protein